MNNINQMLAPFSLDIAIISILTFLVLIIVVAVSAALIPEHWLTPTFAWTCLAALCIAVYTGHLAEKIQ